MTTMAKDQFDLRDPTERKIGSRFFSFYYADMNTAVVLSSTVLVYIHIDLGFDWGWGVEGGIIILGVVLFFTGTKFLSWCTLIHVEELKSMLQILPMWLTAILGFTLYSQIASITVHQAPTLDRKLGPHFTVPAASTSLFLVVTSLIFLPTYEYVLIPTLRKFTGNAQGLSQLKYIGMGLFLTIISMIVAAQVEQKRVNTIKNKNVSTLQILEGGIPMSIFWLLPQYALFGVSDVFLDVNQLKFFYAETSEHMKSVATSLYFSSIAFGYFTSTVIVNTVNKFTKSTGGWLAGEYNTSGLKKYYYLLAIIMVVDLSIFLALAHWY